MLKRFMYISSIICTILSVFFIIKIAEKTYFNEAYYEVPDVKGFVVDEAQRALDEYGLNIKMVGQEYSHYPMGEIYMQDPEPGQVVKMQRNIRVWVSRGNALVEIPNLVGMNFLDARSLAEQRGLFVDKVVSIRTNRAVNEVISTDPATDTLLRRGDRISFLISGTSQFTEVSVPNLEGVDLEVARDKIEGLSLRVGQISHKDNPDVYNGAVLEASLAPGVRVRVGTTINLVVNRSNLERPAEEIIIDEYDVDGGDIDIEDSGNIEDASE